MVVADQRYSVAGTQVPDASGIYEPVGPHDERPSYEQTANGWFLWWDAPDRWIISTEIGVRGANYYERIDTNIEGAYTAEGGAVGFARVTEI